MSLRQKMWDEMITYTYRNANFVLTYLKALIPLIKALGLKIVIQHSKPYLFNIFSVHLLIISNGYLIQDSVPSIARIQREVRPSPGTHNINGTNTCSKYALTSHNLPATIPNTWRM